jgi:hypothetical protein
MAHEMQEVFSGIPRFPGNLILWISSIDFLRALCHDTGSLNPRGTRHGYEQGSEETEETEETEVD